MRLYGQTILIVTLTILAVVTILLIAFELTVMGSLSALEQEYVTQDLNRAENAISGDIERLNAISRDWGIWDATYEYAGEKNPEYLSSNFVQTTLNSLNIDLLAIYDLNGTLIAGLQKNAETGEAGPVSSELDDRIRQSGLITSSPEGKSGIIAGDPFPLMAGTSPVLTSEMSGPARGTVIAASFLDDRAVAHYSHDLQRNISFILLPTEDPLNSGTGREQSERITTLFSDSRVIADVSGEPVFLIRIPSTGDLYRSGLYSRIFLLSSLLVLTILFMGLASWLLNKIIILPLQVLNQDLLRIGESGSLSERIRIRRRDEIGDLGESINTMLSSLQDAQQERIASEQRLSKLIEMVDEGICLVGPDGIIWFANPTMARIFDTTSHDLTGLQLQEILCPENRIVSAPPGERPSGMAGSLCEGGEYHCRSVTGRDVWVRVSTTSYPLDTGKTGMLCVLTDITLFRTTERELLLSNKKLALLGSMTRHDIVNQLTTIRGMLGLIRRKNGDPVLDTLIGSAEDASEKINKHIEFSKEYQKAGIEEPRWQDIRTVWNLAYAMGRRRGLSFTITGDDYEIYADQLLQKVFYNLIDNSIRHGRNLQQITVSSRIDGQDLLIIYEDDGGGIEDAMKERIFERGVGSGTGWGLFFAHEVLELTGMNISESGTFGTGARFIIHVPEGVFREGKTWEPNPGGNDDPSLPYHIREGSDPYPESDPGDQKHQD